MVFVRVKIGTKTKRSGQQMNNDWSAKRFLILEKNPFACQIVADVLHGGHAVNVATALTVEEAVAYLRAHKVDLFIFEPDLEDQSGLDAVQDVRKDGDQFFREVPIIMLVSNPSKELIKQARDLGVDEIVAKPFSPNDLALRLTAALENQRTFIEAQKYTGPDRRRRRNEFGGQERRTVDSKWKKQSEQ